MIAGMHDVRQVEAKYPALLFKQQLTAFVEKIYGMLRDNLKKEIAPLLGLCIQVLLRVHPPTGLRWWFSFSWGPCAQNFSFFGWKKAPRNSRAHMPKTGRGQARAVAQQALIAHWQSIVAILNNYLKTLRANYVS